jgi:hypothetical protein
LDCKLFNLKSDQIDSNHFNFFLKKINQIKFKYKWVRWVSHHLLLIYISHLLLKWNERATFHAWTWMNLVGHYTVGSISVTSKDCRKEKGTLDFILGHLPTLLIPTFLAPSGNLGENSRIYLHKPNLLFKAKYIWTCYCLIIYNNIVGLNCY